MPPLVTRTDYSIPEGNLMKSKKRRQFASFFVLEVRVNYFTTIFWVSVPALTK